MAKKDLIPFKKGHDPRRNVTGANRGSKWLTTSLDEALQKVAEGSKETYHALLIKRVIKKAIVEGDNTMIQHIWNRLEGSAPQTIDLYTTGDTLVIQKDRITSIVNKVLNEMSHEEVTE